MGEDESEPEGAVEPEPAVEDSSEPADFDPHATLASRVRRRSGGKRGRLPARELARGETVGRYVILEKLGVGAMGVVHAAWDPDLDRKIALKLLHGERHGERLLREAQAMARLSHPNVITVHDVGEVEARPGDAASVGPSRDKEVRVFMAMEFVEGGTLATWTAAKTRELSEILEVFIAAGRGLAAAHRSGLVHRDFKPENVMIGHDGRVRVMDFGLVRAASETDEKSALESSSGESPSWSGARSRADALTSSSLLESRLTMEGALLGTPAYMAPEQLRGDPADARSDQFAFCIALWECLFGQRPFAGDNPLAVLYAITRAEFREPPPGRNVPAWMVRVMTRGLAANPAARWPDMDRLIAALADDPRVRTRRWALGLGSVVLAGATALTVGLLWPEPPQIQPPCQAVDQPITEVWHDARASELRQAFASSELVYADDSATRAIAALDRWAGEWSEARRDACEATEVRREQSTDMLDRRMACLDQRLHGFTALVELFVDADATVVEKAVDAVEGLPRLAPCSDRAWLSAAVRPPEEDELAQSVEQVERDTARVHAWIDGGKAGDARELADATDTRARALGWSAAEAQAALARGRVQQELGEFADARDSLERAFYAARLANHDEVAVMAATLLIYGHAVGLNDFVVGAQWLRHAEVEADRLGRTELRAEVDNVAGIYWYMQDRMEESAKAFASALALHERGGAGLFERGSAHVNYGSVIIRIDERRYADEAIAQTEAGVALIERAFGPDHPQVGLALSNFAIVFGYLDRHDEAIAKLEQALDILQRTYGPDHPYTGLTQLNLATNLILSNRDLPRALELAEASLRVHETTMGAEHSMTAESLRTIAQAHHTAGRSERALESIDRAIAIWDVQPATKESAVSIRLLRVLCLLELDRVAEAEAELDLVAERYTDSPARVEAPKTILMIVQALLEHPGQDDRLRSLLALARLGIERTGDNRLLAILGELELAAR
jgi:serine/threonine protein kinase/tetratricopeptide (TPR) repeat protein